MSNRQLAAIMFSDIAGYTAMMQADETLGRKKAQRYRQVLQEQAEAHNGEVLQHYGDGSLSIFGSAVEAARCAKEIQLQLQEAPQVSLRIGIHIGDIVRDGEEIYGDGVNLASRVESLGVPGAVLMTKRVIHDVRSHPDLPTVSLGKFEFKNSAEPIEVFALTSEGLAIPDAKSLSGKGQRLPDQPARSKIFMRGLVYGFLGVTVGALLWLGYAMSSKENTQAVEYVDEQGNVVIRETPKQNQVRKVLIFPFENQLKNPEKDWYRFAIPILLNQELGQDMRVYSLHTMVLKEYYDDYRVPFLEDMPFATRLKIAQDLYVDYFFDGQISTAGDSLEVALSMYSLQTSKAVLSLTIRGKDVYEVSDKLHDAISSHLFPGESPESLQYVDLPAADLISSNIDALEQYVSAELTRYKNITAIPQIIQGLKQAVKLDPGCAECHAALGNIQITSTSGEQAVASLETAIALAGDLPERRQLTMKTLYYIANNQPDKGLALMERWKELYPSDYQPYGMLMNQYQRTYEYDKAKQIGEEALENGHKGRTLLTLANLYSKTDDYETAEKYYEEYARLYPTKSQKLVQLGTLYIDQGELDRARTYFEKLLLVNPNDNSVTVRLANIEARTGNWPKMETLLNEALRKARTPQDSVAIYVEWESYYIRTGQLRRYLEYSEKKWNTMAHYFPQTGITLNRFFTHASIYADLGQEAVFQEKLQEIRDQFPQNAYAYSCVGNYVYAIGKQELESFEKWSTECEGVLITYMGDNFKYLSKSGLLMLQKDYKGAATVLETYLTNTGLRISSLESSNAEIFRKSDQLQKAIMLVDQKLLSDPAQPYDQVQQARNFLAAGNKTKAQEVYARAMELLKDADPDSRQFQRAQEFAQELADS